MKRLFAILAVLACVAFGSQPAFAQNRHHDRSNFNVQVTPWGTGITIGGRNGSITIGDGYYNGYRPNGYYGYRYDRRYDRGYDYRYDRRYDYRRYDRGYDYRYNQPRLRQPYYYFDRYGRQVYVDAYGNHRIVNGYRGGRW